MMRYSKAMVRSSVVAVVCGLVCGCATARPEPAPTALERAVAEDDDLGAPGPSEEDLRAREAARAEDAQAMLEDPDATRIDFDGEEANDAPVDIVMVPPDRSPSKSFMQDIVMGPSS